MRNLQTIGLICLIVLAGCAGESYRNTAIKRFIPGTYVKEVKKRFSYRQ